MTQEENMKKVYLVFTVNDTKTVNIEVFIDKEDAIKRIDDYSDAQVNLENSEIYDKYSDEFVPQEIYQMFWPVGKILYGTRVKKCFETKGFYKSKIIYTTDRFVVEKEVI